MNPTAADTESVRCAIARPTTPPIRANGTLRRMMSASQTDSNAEKKEQDVRIRASG